jgi:hypothetical protein
MSVDLDRQLQEYCRLIDEKQGALSVEDILERSGELQVIPGQWGRHSSPERRSVKTLAVGAGRGLAWAVAAFVVILTVGGLYLAFTGDNHQVVDQTTVPTPTTVLTTTPDPTTALGEVVHGWPSTTENPAGLYSWGGACVDSCIMGFMHNGYGSGDVAILIEVLPERAASGDDATAVSIAGHDGTYRRIDDRREEWIVDIEATTVAIRLEAEPGTSQADLDEAHAIIDSMWTQPRDNRRGFRLVFTLATDDWDSG